MLLRVDEDGESDVLLEGTVCAGHPYAVTDEWLVAAILADRRCSALPTEFDWGAFTREFDAFANDQH